MARASIAIAMVALGMVGAFLVRVDRPERAVRVPALISIVSPDPQHEERPSVDAPLCAGLVPRLEAGAGSVGQEDDDRLTDEESGLQFTPRAAAADIDDLADRLTLTAEQRTRATPIVANARRRYTDIVLALPSTNAATSERLASRVPGTALTNPARAEQIIASLCRGREQAVRHS